MGLNLSISFHSHQGLGGLAFIKLYSHLIVNEEKDNTTEYMLGGGSYEGHVANNEV